MIGKHECASRYHFQFSNDDWQADFCRYRFHHFLENSLRLSFCPMNLLEWTVQHCRNSNCQCRRNGMISSLLCPTVKHRVNVIGVNFFCETHKLWFRGEKKIRCSCEKLIETNYGQYSWIERSHLCLRLWPFESNNEIIFLSSLLEAEVWFLRLPWSMCSRIREKKVDSNTI